MTPRDPAYADFTAAEVAAVEWLQRNESGLSSQEREEFGRWLTSPLHARLYRQLEYTAGIFERSSEAAAKVVPFAPAVSREATRLRWRMPSVLAAAAAFAVVAALNWSTLFPDKTPYAAMAATEVGGLRTVDLPDGSTVRLNTSSQVDIRYTESERRVVLLSGEALFEVAKNRARPFYVEAAGISVRAVGTAFNVRLRPESVEVLVTEGRVRVEDANTQVSKLPGADSPGEPPVLAAGHRVLVSLPSIEPDAPAPPVSITTVSPPEIEQALAWQEQRLKFASVPLSEVVAEFNRYNQHKLVIADKRLGMELFGGTFRSDRYETLVSLLEQNFDVVIERHPNETILRRKTRG